MYSSFSLELAVAIFNLLFQLSVNPQVILFLLLFFFLFALFFFLIFSILL